MGEIFMKLFSFSCPLGLSILRIFNNCSRVKNVSLAMNYIPIISQVKKLLHHINKCGSKCFFFPVEEEDNWTTLSGDSLWQIRNASQLFSRVYSLTVCERHERDEVRRTKTSPRGVTSRQGNPALLICLQIRPPHSPPRLSLPPL